VSDDFFVGYLPAPASCAARTRRIAWWLLGASVAGAALFAAATGPFDRAVFEYGETRAWRGTIETEPVPVLLARESSDGSPFAAVVRYPLVAEGKHGAGGVVAAFDGRPVTVRGRRIVRGSTTMIELADIEPYEPALPTGGPPPPATRIVDEGRRVLTGEIVDSKCFLGVMNPGRLAVHRACALRCLAGGIPPMLFARDERGREAHLILVAADGSPLGSRIADLVGRPVEVSGRLERRDDLDYLYADGWRLIRR